MDKQFGVEFTFRYANPAAVSVSVRLDTGQVVRGQQVLANRHHLPLDSLNVPLELRITQRNRVELRTRLHLTRPKRFVWGQPASRRGIPTWAYAEDNVLPPLPGSAFEAGGLAARMFWSDNPSDPEQRESRFRLVGVLGPLEDRAGDTS